MALRAPDTTYTHSDLSKLFGLCVYAWKRGEDFLYVGITSNGLGRICKHNIINAVEAFLPTDELMIWEGFNCYPDAEAFEWTLIQARSPRFNKKWNLGDPKPAFIKCVSCGKDFKPRRAWQLYCSQPCRRPPVASTCGGWQLPK